MTDCIFCKIISNDIPADKIFEDDFLVVFRDIRPKAKVHLLIVAKEHIPSLFWANSTHEKLLSHMLLTAPLIAKQEGLLNGFRTVINTGSGGGQEIDHIHFHVLGGGNLPRF
jgi:histidine triad (HIT) family protein